MIDGKNFFDQPVNINLKTYENIRKIATGQEDDYTTDFGRLFLFQRKLQNDCNRFKQTTSS